MQIEQLAPRSLGALLDAGFRLFRRHALVLMLTAALGALPGLLAVVLTDALAVHLIASLLGGLIAVVVRLGVIQFVHARALGQDARLMDCISDARRRFLAACGVSGLVMVVTMLPWLLLLLGQVSVALGALGGLLAALLSFVATVFLMFALQVLVIEGERRGALRRSAALVRGHFWRVVGVVAVFLFLGMLIALAMGATQLMLDGPVEGGASGDALRQFLERFTVSSVPNALVGLVSGAILGPLQFIVLTLLYIDIRIRKEGYDVEVMADGLDSTAPS